jgi:hypothetical protein
MRNLDLAVLVFESLWIGSSRQRLRVLCRVSSSARFFERLDTIPHFFTSFYTMRKKFEIMLELDPDSLAPNR